MSLRQLRTEAVARLADAGVDSPAADAESLLAHVLGVPRTRLALAEGADDDQRRLFEQLVARRARREPLQHLTGSASFRRVDLRVGPGVFVPRPETELLAGWAADQAATRPDPVVVDLCTGSGAIAAAIADEVPGARLHAVEVSPSAYAYAVDNLTGCNVDVRLGDLADAFRELDNTVDVVVANPPYIPLAAYEGVEPEARLHDPPVALWSGQDGLDTIREVSRVAARLLKPGGVVGCEHADSQGESAPAVFRAHAAWCAVVDHHDLAARPRYLTARRR